MKLTLVLLLALLASACVIVPTSGPGGGGAKASGGTVLLCHKGKKTMELPQEAARAHIDHGDRYGPC